VELLSYFKPTEPGLLVQAVPGAGLNIPVWLLGSSTFSAQLAAMLGLRFAFASHFAPDQMQAALDLYRARFQPSEQLAQPYAMLGVSVVAADTDDAALRLFTSLQQQFLALQRGRPVQLQPPVDSMEGRWSEWEQAAVERTLRHAIVGGPETVRRGLEAFAARTNADEIMITAHIYDHAARLRSFEIVHEIASESPLGVAVGRNASGDVSVNRSA
jgi:luciferase family oxidoreductase group 1